MFSFSDTLWIHHYKQPLLQMAATKGTILVTGANGGLGSAIVEQIASQSELSAYYGLYAVRDAKSAPALVSTLAHGAVSHRHDTLSLDLTKLDNVRQVAEGINVSHLIISHWLLLFVILV